jgi:hypothetical protein
VPIGGAIPDTTKIHDAGFLLTQPIYNFLKERQDINDYAAAFNSVFLGLGVLYALKVTLWVRKTLLHNTNNVLVLIFPVYTTIGRGLLPSIQNGSYSII